MPDNVKITIDGKELEVAPGTSLLKAALENGIKIPHFCYHPGLKVAGNCRICLVEIEKAPKLSISCNEGVREGLVIHTNSERVLKARAAVLEFMLINHPLDCSVCDKSGECMLQNITYDHRKDPDDAYIDSRMAKDDKHVPPTKELGEKIMIWANRCIHCSRCIRFTEEISGTGELSFYNRGAHSQIDIHSDNPLNNHLAGNVVDLCPVGALLDKDFLYQSRVWFMDKRSSICTGCSKGCNIRIDSNENELKRIKPRRNDAVNSFWICDHGRYNRDYFEAERIAFPTVDGKEVNRKEAVKVIAEALKKAGSAVGAVGSAQSSVEDNYALRLLMENLESSNFSVRNVLMGEKETFPKFEIEAEKAPNKKGALAVFNLDETGTDALCAQINSGQVKAVVALGNEMHVPLTSAEQEAFGKLDFLAVIDSWNSPLAKLANVVLPAAIFVEKEGSFVNSAGRIQHLTQALIPFGTQAASEWVWLKRLSEEFDAGWEFSSAAKLFDLIAKSNTAFSGASYSEMGKTGFELKQ